MFLSIVIAIYNEEGNVEELTKRIYSSMNVLRIPFELIYIIDGRDKSFEILKHIKKSKKNLILDHSPELRGFRNAFIRGFKLISKKTTHILTMDGDLNHRPEEIKYLVDRMDKGDVDIVIGSRYLKNKKIGVPLWKQAVSKFANLIITLLWGLRIHDKTSGFRLYDKQVILKIPPLCRSNNFEFLLELLVLSKKHGFRIDEVPIIYDVRKKGKSKFDLFKVAKGYLRLIFRNI